MMNWPDQKIALRQFSAAGRMRISILMIAAFGLAVTPDVSFARTVQEPESGTDLTQESVSEEPTLKAETATTQQPRTNKSQDLLQQLQASVKQKSHSTTNSTGLQSSSLDHQDDKQRVESIHQRIRQLKNILESERSTAEANRRRASQPKAANSSTPPAPSSTASTKLNSPESNLARTPVIVPPEIIQPEITQEPEPNPADNLLPDGIQVLANPVNSFELANSLFATGSYGQALKSYESLLQTEVSESDRNWLLCLSANCYRLQGDHAKAESLYREVISTRDKSYATDYSQWFLDHLTKKKQMQEELRLLTGEIESLAPGDSL